MGTLLGSMVVIVETAIGSVCLTSDVMYNYRNLELNWPMGSFWNLPELLRGLRPTQVIADVIVPEHDWQIPRGVPVRSHRLAQFHL